MPVLPEEALEIQKNAAACGLKVATYLRTLCLNHEPKGIADADAIIELAKVNADLGRLGGLFKMWLTNDNRLKPFGKAETVPMINGLMQEIKSTQTLLFEIAKKL